jgi:hypothetical protein
MLCVRATITLEGHSSQNEGTRHIELHLCIAQYIFVEETEGKCGEKHTPMTSQSGAATTSERARGAAKSNIDA